MLNPFSPKKFKKSKDSIIYKSKMNNAIFDSCVRKV